jgi:hypothetical protein
MNVYIAAPFHRAAEVRDFHKLVRELGMNVVSTWANDAKGKDDLAEKPLDVARAVGRRNDRDLLSAHLVIAIAHEEEGGEMFAEVRLALVHRIPVLWLGSRRTLSSFREGVLCVETLKEALVYLAGLADMVSGLTVFERRKARETLWTTIEGLQGKQGQTTDASAEPR